MRQRGQKNNPTNCSAYTHGTKKPPTNRGLYYTRMGRLQRWWTRLRALCTALPFHSNVTLSRPSTFIPIFNAACSAGYYHRLFFYAAKRFSSSVDAHRLGGKLIPLGSIPLYHHCKTTPTIQSITAMKVIAAIIQSCQSIIPQPPCALLRYKMRPLLPLSNTNHQGQSLYIRFQSCHSNRLMDAASFPCRHSCHR